MFPPSSTYAHCHAPAPAATVTFFYERKLRAQKDACCTRLASLCCRIFTAKNCLRHLHGSTALFCSLPSAPPISPTIQTNPSQKSPYSHFSTRNMFSKGEFLFYLSFCLAGYRSGFNLWCKTKVLVGYSPRRRLHLLFPLRCVLVRSWRRLKFKVFWPITHGQTTSKWMHQIPLDTGGPWRCPCLSFRITSNDRLTGCLGVRVGHCSLSGLCIRPHWCPCFLLVFRSKCFWWRQIPHAAGCSATSRAK